MDRSRAKIGIFSNPLKALNVFLIASAYHPKFIQENQIFKTFEPLYFWALFIHISSSLIFYMSCSLAFKLRMHRFAFALPVTLLTPVMLVLSCCFCQLSVGDKFWLQFKGKLLLLNKHQMPFL